MKSGDLNAQTCCRMKRAHQNFIKGTQRGALIALTGLGHIARDCACKIGKQAMYFIPLLTSSTRTPCDFWISGDE